MLLPLCVLLSVLHAYLCIDLTYYVEEGKNSGVLVGDIAADSHLLDSVPHQDRGLITFSQLQQDTTSGSPLFRVSKNGKLYTIQSLDTESLCSRHMDCFKMVDIAVRKAKSFMKILEVKVIIQDVNDHQPEFPSKQVNIQFEEDDRKGVSRSIPNAVDRDVGIINSQITYQLKKNMDEPFALSVSKSVDGTSKLGIKLEDELDRETKDSYRLQLIAKDGGSPPKQDVLHIYISVTDVNDNIPQFTHKVYNVSIRKEQDNSLPIVTLTAKDMDSEKNGRVSYYFSSQTSGLTKSVFELNEVTGEVFLSKSFNFTSDKKQTHKLFIEARDGGSPSLSSIAMVLVNVINQKNNPPVIDVNFFSESSDKTAIISEDVEVGSFIAYVKVTDRDVGQNGEVSCDLRHDKFQLQTMGKKKYKIILKNSVDRETEDQHEVTVTCQDKGSPPLHSDFKFSIQVLDTNDVQPQFSKETYKFRIYENQKSKISVGYINATDTDLGPGGKLTYSLLTKSRHFLPFQITESGLISTIDSLDHELQDVYKFQVLVKDNGKPSLQNTVNVIVEVRDENDNAPYFTFPSVNPFTMDVVYYPHHTNNITVLKASDSDSRENAFLKYEITAGNEKQLFTINHYTGLLSFTRVVTHQDAGSYELEFVVKDSGNPVLSATTTMFMTLTVSNKTSEMSNAVHIKTNDKIHLNLVVIITLIAVTISVIITATMSICILRCCYRRNAPPEDEVNTPHRCISEQRHLMCPSLHATSWPDVPGAITTTQGIGSTHLTDQRRDSHPGSGISSQQKGLSSSLKPRASSENTHQVNKNTHITIFFAFLKNFTLYLTLTFP